MINEIIDNGNQVSNIFAYPDSSAFQELSNFS